ncbi:peptidoglycan recognition protein family protein [Lacticaseibacillus zhaodongensis]|uniref:peptidoglycan recognition protein family protein n=1 Tax=Lacticaseibacillus zhaodongensis TaxID=2668065 RepID=UPI0012D2FD99|nr:peptidoglycan recognition family protein [Lacticaseibacillus zhaodongensis]
MKLKHRLALLAALGTTFAFALTLGQTAPVNAATVNQQAAAYKPAKITTMKSTFPYKQGFRAGVGRPEGVLIHETAEPNWNAATTAKNMNKDWKSKSSYVHAAVDATAIDKMMSTDYKTWGAGAVANARFISVELCETKSQTDFVKSVNNLAYYTATLLRQYNLRPDLATHDGLGTVWSHFDVSHYLGGTDHSDPVGYFAQHGYDMDQLYALIQTWYNKLGYIKPQASAKNANVVKLGAATGVYTGPSYNYRKIKTLRKSSSWKYFSAQVTRGQFWFNLGGNQWIRVGGLSTPTITVKGTSAIQSGPGSDYKVLGTLAKGKTVGYSNLVYNEGKLWYQFKPGQWFANGVNFKTKVTPSSSTHGVIFLGKTSVLRAGTSDSAKAVRNLIAGTSWKYSAIKKVNGGTWYCLGGNQWVKA